jgi:hypothetical protein
MKQLSFLLLFFTLSTFSQSLESLKPIAKKLYDANYLMSFQDVVEHTYPKYVESVTKEYILEKLDLDYQNDEFRMRLQLVSVVFIYGEIKKIEGTSFCVITFKNPIRYFYENKISNDNRDDELSFLKVKDKTEDVTFEPKRNSFNVRKTSTYLAIADEKTNNQWKILNFDDAGQYEFYKTNFSENVKTVLGL